MNSPSNEDIIQKDNEAYEEDYDLAECIITTRIFAKGSVPKTFIEGRVPEAFEMNLVRKGIRVARRDLVHVMRLK